MLDVESAFLQNKIDEEVFAKQAPGYEIVEAITGIPMVIKLRHSAFSLKIPPAVLGTLPWTTK